MSVSLLIAGAIAHLQDRIPSGIEIITTEKRINIHQKNIEKLKEVCEHAEISDISFDKNSLNLSLELH